MKMNFDHYIWILIMYDKLLGIVQIIKINWKNIEIRYYIKNLNQLS